MRKRELRYGMVREPPAPYFSHQQLVLRVARLLCAHVEPRNLGEVAVAPLDVVLDVERALILQPDVLFVARERLAIINQQVWGPPDLVAEVLSDSTERTTAERNWLFMDSTASANAGSWSCMPTR